MLKVGQKVVCIDGSPVRSDCATVMPLRLIAGAIYTVRAVHIESGIDGYGVHLDELPNPSVVFSDSDEREWSYASERFRPLMKSETDELATATAD